MTHRLGPLPAMEQLQLIGSVPRLAGNMVFEVCIKSVLECQRGALATYRILRLLTRFVGTLS